MNEERYAKDMWAETITSHGPVGQALGFAKNIETLEVAAAILKGLADEMECDPVEERVECLAASRLGTAVALLDARRLSRSIFGELPILNGPCWDILMDMYVSRACGRKVSTSDASLAGGCPATTGLRWVHLLCEAGLIERSPDAADRRRMFLELTPLGVERVESALDCYFRKAGPVGLG